jgi:hypothetical protein
MSGPAPLPLKQFVELLEEKGTMVVKMMPQFGGGPGAPAAAKESKELQPVLFINVPGYSSQGVDVILGDPDAEDSNMLPFFGATPSVYTMGTTVGPDDTLGGMLIMPSPTDAALLQRLQAWFCQKGDEANQAKDKDGKPIPFLPKKGTNIPVASVAESEMWSEPVKAPRSEDKPNWVINVKLRVLPKATGKGSDLTKFGTYTTTGDDAGIVRPVPFDNTTLVVKGQRAVVVASLATAIRKTPKGFCASFYAKTVWMPRNEAHVPAPVSSLGRLRMATEEPAAPAAAFSVASTVSGGGGGGGGSGGSGHAAAAAGISHHVSALDVDVGAESRPAKSARVSDTDGAVTGGSSGEPPVDTSAADTAADTAPAVDTAPAAVVFATDLASAMDKLPAAATAAAAAAAVPARAKGVKRTAAE